MAVVDTSTPRHEHRSRIYAAAYLMLSSLIIFAPPGRYAMLRLLLP